MRKFTKVMNETVSKLKDIEQTIEEESLTQLSTDVDVLKTEFDGIKRDQVLNEQNDEKLRMAVNDLKK